MIVITGANGFIGRKLVVSVLNLGYKNVRCFVRPSGDTTLLESIKADYPEKNVEILKGNLLSGEECAAAAKGMSIVYQLAAGKEKTSNIFPLYCLFPILFKFFHIKRIV